jgi:hypothetical protein
MTHSTFLVRCAVMAVVAALSTALAQPAPAPRAALVPCTPDATGPCVQVATSVDDIVGVWKQYLGNPALEAPDRMGFIRYRPDGSMSLAPTAGDTSAPFGAYPRGTISFEGDVATMLIEGDAVPPECRTATVHIHVLRHDGAPVALAYLFLQDECVGRRADLELPAIWVGD